MLRDAPRRAARKSSRDQTVCRASCPMVGGFPGWRVHKRVQIAAFNHPSAGRKDRAVTPTFDRVLELVEQAREALADDDPLEADRLLSVAEDLLLNATR